jgi:ceramide glucosyltransferase
MMAGMRIARGDLVAFGDSDSRPDRDVLRVLVLTLMGTAGAGSAFAPVVASSPAITAGDLAYALMINGLYGAAVGLAAAPTGDLPFIMGQLMVFRREALDAVGGLSCAEGHLVDDMQIGACLSAAGWRNVPSSHPLRIVTGGMDLPSFLKLMRRWLFFQRGGLPHSFTAPLWLRGFEFGFGLAAGLGLLVSGHPAEAIPPLLAMVAVAWSVASLHRAYGGAPIAARHLLVPFGLFLAGPLAHLAAILKPAVQWRGRDYALDARARLDAPLPSASSRPEPDAVARVTRGARS